MDYDYQASQDAAAREKGSAVRAEFLRPTWAKLILFLILMGGINSYLISTGYRPDIKYLAGSPLGFWPIGFAFIQNPPPVNFSPVNFVIDVIFWYLIAAAIVYIFRR